MRLVTEWMDESMAEPLLEEVKRLGFPCGIERLNK